jgi:site-specific DNA recombinase
MPKRKSEATKAVGYVRLSKYDEGTTSPQRQRAAIRSLCRDRGWKLGEVYEDIDVSAYSGARRSGLERMLSELDKGSAVVVYRIDRLARSAPEFARILEAFHQAGVEFAATDLQVDSSPAGTLVRDLVARLAQFESDQISVRSRAMIAYKRGQGEPLGRVPFGWKRNGKGFEPDPGEQAILADAARRYIDGEGFVGIAEALGFSHPAVVRRMLKSQRVQDALPPRLAGPLAEALVARQHQRVPTSKQSLLGGIARCGTCGKGMVQSSTRAGRTGRWYQYRCQKPGHAGISGRWLDEYVTAAVLDAVDSKRLVKAIRKRQGSGRSRKVSEIEAKIELLTADYYERDLLSREVFTRRHAALVEQLAEARKAEQGAGVSIAEGLAHNLSEKWSGLSIGTRRRIVGAVLKGITVKRAPKGSGKIDAKRVKLDWRS